ncbi:MAG: polysaccharide deacetylase family protein [Pseudomonadales bacterium]
MTIPVLMYHAIGNTATGTQQYDDADFTVSERKFRTHLDYLKAQGFTAALPAELSNSGFDHKACLITFDDGHASDAAVALPLLQEYGFSAVFFITTAWIGKSGYMSEQAIKLLSDAGMEVGSHGHTHKFFNDMTYKEALDELQLSAQILSRITGLKTKSFSAPGGQIPERLSELTAAVDLDYVCTSSTGTCGPRNFPFAIPRTAIRKDLSDSDFIRIVECDPSFYRRVLFRSAVLGGIRRVLGNNLYMSMRERLL